MPMKADIAAYLVEGEASVGITINNQEETIIAAESARDLANDIWRAADVADDLEEEERARAHHRY